MRSKPMGQNFGGCVRKGVMGKSLQRLSHQGESHVNDGGLRMSLRPHSKW